MTKTEFDMLLDKAAAGDTGAMRGMAMICFQMAEGGMNNNDIKAATMYMELGNGWKAASENGLKNAGQVKTFTKEAFNGCF